MKKIIAIFTAAILMFLVGCSSTNNPEDITQGDNTTISDITSTKIIEQKIKTEKLVLQSGEFSLNAVYTYIDDGNKYPTVLFIAGSGPSDYDSTIGSLKPLGDIANELVKNGICSLRVDKRTLNYGAAFKNTDGIEEEYLIDCRVAIEYIKSRNNTGDMYLLGHSFGGQIASILAKENEDIKGIILFNSSARHLSAIACDQYIREDSSNKSSYEMYRDLAMNATFDNSKGLYYYGASDYYWSSVNKYDTITNLEALTIPILIINSTYDLQCFAADISLWESELGDYDNVQIYIDDKISHLGYELDLSKEEFVLTDASFPQRIIKKFADFINME